MKFVNAKSTVCALTSYVVREDQGYGAFWRPAKTQGGRWSGSGATLFAPFWVEQGAVLAVREDCLPNSPEVFAAQRGQVPLLVFSGHGTSPENIREIDPAKYAESLQTWSYWRRYKTCAPPTCRCEEDYLAKRATRGTGPNLTAGEALRGLAQRNGAGDAQLSIQYEPAHAAGYWPESWEWGILVKNIGRARGYSEVEGAEPTYFVFEPLEREESEEEESGKTWKVYRTFHVFQAEDGLKAEYRWSRSYPLPDESGYQKWHIEYATSSEADRPEEWAKERPW